MDTAHATPNPSLSGRRLQHKNSGLTRLMQLYGWVSTVTVLYFVGRTEYLTCLNDRNVTARSQYERIKNSVMMKLCAKIEEACKHNSTNSDIVDRELVQKWVSQICSLFILQNV